MSVAICVSGQPRTGAWVAPHLREWAAGYPGRVDWFVHLWDSSCQKRSFHGQIFQPHDVTHAEVSAIRDVLCPRAMAVAHHDSAMVDRGLVLGMSGISQLLGIHLCDQLRLDWSRRTGLWHDVVIRARPDVVYPRANTMPAWAWAVRNRDPGILWSAVCDERRVDDVIWAATPDTMSMAAQHWQAFVGRHQDIDHEGEFHAHLRAVGVEPRQVPLEHAESMYAPVREGFGHLDPLAEFGEIYKADLRLYSYSQVSDRGITMPTEAWFVAMDHIISAL